MLVLNRGIQSPALNGGHPNQPTMDIFVYTYIYTYIYIYIYAKVSARIWRILEASRSLSGLPMDPVHLGLTELRGQYIRKQSALVRNRLCAQNCCSSMPLPVQRPRMNLNGCSRMILSEENVPVQLNAASHRSAPLYSVAWVCTVSH